jgi:hypothetical protein
MYARSPIRRTRQRRRHGTSGGFGDGGGGGGGRDASIIINYRRNGIVREVVLTRVTSVLT